ncbi:MAG: 4-oxalocrotonate tautomerase [Oscillospiraceae bacterium]|nr:4-oxalocrotonate tautomerase [Oscillospiraceae bacterium]
MDPAEPTVNLCAQIPGSLMARIREEQEKAGLPRGEYITQILTSYYENQNGGDKNMEFTKTLAFQIPEELFNRIKDHLEREKQRTGKRLTQRDFVIGLIEQALEEAERQDADESSEGGDGNADVG